MYADEKLTAFLELEAAIRGSPSFTHPFTVRRHSAGTETYDESLIDLRRELYYHQNGFESCGGLSPRQVLRLFRTRNRRINLAGKQKGRTMNPFIQLKTTAPLLMTLTLFCLGLLPQAQAVVPPPDGGYPNFTTAEGQNALLSLTTGVGNTAVGWSSLSSNAEGNFNTATGAGALLFNTADENTAVGAAALLFNTTGFGNIAVGSSALLNNTTGRLNTAIGQRALNENTEGFGNTAIGDRVFRSNTTGNENTALGRVALSNNTSGDNNVALGVNAGSNVTTASNVICIGAEVEGANVSNHCFIGNIYSNIQPIVGTNPDSVTITMSGRLGRGNVSSRRYKHDIKPMERASDALYALRPVSFRYHKEYDSTQKIAFGLIAEEVAEVYPDLVGRNPQGQPESVRYEQINAMLLNEFLKEHRKNEQQGRDIQEQEATIARLNATVARQEATGAEQQKEIQALATTVKEQAAQIQKVNAQLELSKPAPQTAENNQ